MCGMSDEIEKTQYNWTDLETSYPCEAVQTQDGNSTKVTWWSGYVMVPKDHPLYGVPHTDEIFPRDIRVHGGISWSAFQIDDRTAWAIGFDCSHGNDWVLVKNPDPLAETLSLRTKASINLDYVKRQCSKLAAQLHALAPKKLLRSWLCWQLIPSEEPDVMDTTPSAFLPVGTELVRVHYLSRDGWCAQVWGADGLGQVYYGTDHPLNPELT